MFAKEFEKCRLLTNLLGRNVENLDDYGWKKIQDFVKTDSSWICSCYPFRQKKRLHCAERKAKVYGDWAMEHLQILYVFIVFVFTILIWFFHFDMFLFYSIHFEKLSLRNRWLIKKKILIKENLSLAATIKRGNLGPVWDKPVPDRWLFLSQLFVNLLIIFGCFWRIHLSKFCDQSTVWVGILCSAAWYFLTSPRLWTN